WAPVNAGFSAQYIFGLMHQWHRKYGQTYNEDPQKTILPGPVSLTEGNKIENKNIFYTNGDFGSGYWCDTKPQEWDMSSQFNPCPEGWRVPRPDEFSQLVSEGSSWTDGGGYDNLPGRWYGGNH